MIMTNCFITFNSIVVVYYVVILFLSSVQFDYELTVLLRHTMARAEEGYVPQFCGCDFKTAAKIWSLLLIFSR